MKNTMWVWVAIAVVVILAFVLGSKNRSDSTKDVNDTSTTDETSNVTPAPVSKTPPPAPISGMKVSLGGIFAEKGNYQCDYEQVSQQTRSTNVVYISNGKMRGEFRTSTALISTATMVVYDGSYLYVWTEGKSTGTRSEPKTIADLPGIIPEDVSSGRILGSSSNNVSWNCHAWAVKPSLIAKPTYVSF
ncbi:MAG: hypothetical protein CEO12_452 [Parcubacteria group bacterium Gr01-1014_46]|nr:MAG: hypothetical protein CEO12_452 [Parcubacteria group bacterium Gr01-1014_46]